MEITFLNDHLVHRDAGPGDWSVGLPFEGLSWKLHNNPNHPVCYTRAQPLRIRIRLKLTGTGSTGETSGARVKVTGPDGITGQTNEFSTTCGRKYVTLTFSTTALPNAIRRYEPMILEWSVKEPGIDTFAYFQSTIHNIYTIWAAPQTEESQGGSKLTKRRLSEVLCEGFVNAASTADNVLSGMHKNLDNDPPNDPPEWEAPINKRCNDWRIMSEVRDAGGYIHTGECHHQAYFLNRCLRTIGHPGGTVQLIYASTDDDPTDEEPPKTGAELGYNVDLDGNGVDGDELFRLIFDFPNSQQPGQRNWNNFEGCLVVNGQYYAVWPRIHGVSACNLYGKLTAPQDPYDSEAIGAVQYWVFFLPGGGYVADGPIATHPKCR